MFFFFIPGHWAKTALYLPIGTFRGGKNFCKNFSLFSFLCIGPKSSDFWQFFPANCRNCFLSFQKLKLRKIVPANLVFLQFFSDIERKIVKYWREVSGSTFKTAFKVSKSVPWGNFISFKIDDIFQISCGLQQKKLKNRLLWKLFFFLYRSFSENLSAFVEKFSAGLWKLHSKCPQETFGDFIFQ